MVVRELPIIGDVPKCPLGLGSAVPSEGKITIEIESRPPRVSRWQQPLLATNHRVRKMGQLVRTRTTFDASTLCGRTDPTK